MAQAAKSRIRTVSSNDAKQHWGAMMKAASEGEDVVVESHGNPKVVVISTDSYKQLQQAREEARRKEALQWMREFEKEQMERNKDLTQEEADELANRAAHEIFDELAAEGKLRFARDEPRT